MRCWLLALLCLAACASNGRDGRDGDAGPAGHLTTYEVYAAPVAFASGQLANSSAFCRSQKDTAISGGCLISKMYTVGGVTILGSYPDHDAASPDRWSCHASNVSGRDADLTTMVICEVGE